MADRLVVDHAVPVSVLRRMLWGARPAGLGDIQNFLERWFVLGVVTLQEDLRLRAAGTTSEMPADWAGDDPFARYCAVGIA